MSAFLECVSIGFKAYRLARAHYRRERTEAFGQIDVVLVDRPPRLHLAQIVSNPSPADALPPSDPRAQAWIQEFGRKMRERYDP